MIDIRIMIGPPPFIQKSKIGIKYFYVANIFQDKNKDLFCKDWAVQGE